MSYRIAEETVAGYLTHVFVSCDEFEAWAREHPKHGPIVSRAFAGMSGRPMLSTIDHRLDERQEAEAPDLVENMRLF